MGSSSKLGGEQWQSWSRKGTWLLCEEDVLQQLSEGLGPAQSMGLVFGMSQREVIAIPPVPTGIVSFRLFPDLSKSLQG